MGIAIHLLYLAISIAFTVLVGHSLFSCGKPYLLECLGNKKTANAVNRLFLAGFYLMNIGLVLVLLENGEAGESLRSNLEALAERVGFVALVMGCMHFNNLFWCELIRSRRNPDATF